MWRSRPGIGGASSPGNQNGVNAGLVLPLLAAGVEGEAAGAHPARRPIGLRVAAPLGVPFGRPGATAGAALGLAEHPPDRFVAVVLRPRAIAAEELAVRHPEVV